MRKRNNRRSMRRGRGRGRFMVRGMGRLMRSPYSTSRRYLKPRNNWLTVLMVLGFGFAFISPFRNWVKTKILHKK